MENKKIKPYNHWTRRFQRWWGGEWTAYGDECFVHPEREGVTWADDRSFCEECVINGSASNFAPLSYGYTKVHSQGHARSVKRWIARTWIGILIAIPVGLLIWGDWIFVQRELIQKTPIIGLEIIPAFLTGALIMIGVLAGIVYSVEWARENL